jgi:hypothetical protein
LRGRASSGSEYGRQNQLHQLVLCNLPACRFDGTAEKAIAWVGPKAPEGHSEFYYNLVRFFQKAKTEAEIVPPTAGPDMESELRFTTIGYGVANWYLANGETAKAKAYFERIVQGKVWGTWGYVGSEVELARMRK